MAKKCRDEHEGRDESREERRDQSVLCRLGKPPAPEVRCCCAGDKGVDGQTEGDDEGGATQLRHGVPSGGVAALLGRVLRGALRDHRTRLRDERAIAELPVNHDVTPDLEEIRDGA